MTASALSRCTSQSLSPLCPWPFLMPLKAWVSGKTFPCWFCQVNRMSLLLSQSCHYQLYQWSWIVQINIHTAISGLESGALEHFAADLRPTFDSLLLTYFI